MKLASFTVQMSRAFIYIAHFSVCDFLSLKFNGKEEYQGYDLIKNNFMM